MSCDLAGETALLHMTTGVYYTLDSVATALWQLIDAQTPIRRLHEMMVTRYDVESMRSADDLLAFLDQLSALEIVRITR